MSRSALSDRLLRFLSRQPRPESLLIMTHDHPDPDAMASAFALAYLASRVYGIRIKMVYGGAIGRMENRTMVDVLRLPVSALAPEDLTAFQHVALVDTQPPFGNNSFPIDRTAYLVIDHHPRHRRTRAGLALIQTRFGATATILAQALLSLKRRLPTRLATAMAYGIASETQNLGREAGARDIEAYLALLPRCDMRLLGRMQHPRRSRSFFRTVGHAMQNAFLSGRLIGVHLEEVETPDLVAQLADFLVACQGVRWSICTGRYQGRLHVSLRLVQPGTVEAGTLLSRTLGKRGRAGGHGMIAGGSLELPPDAGESDWRRIEQWVVRRLTQRLQDRPVARVAWPFRSKRRP